MYDIYIGTNPDIEGNLVLKLSFSKDEHAKIFQHPEIQKLPYLREMKDFYETVNYFEVEIKTLQQELPEFKSKVTDPILLALLTSLQDVASEAQSCSQLIYCAGGD